MRFFDRIEKYGAVTGRTFPEALRKQFNQTRKLRHAIVHDGYRISVSGRGAAQQLVHTGRWTFNWFEEDQSRAQLRGNTIRVTRSGTRYGCGHFPARVRRHGRCHPVDEAAVDAPRRRGSR